MADQVKLAALMVDVDGVVVRRPAGRRWDADLLADVGVDPGELDTAFIAPHFDGILTGRSHLLDRLEQVLASIAPNVSARDLIDYWSANDATVDEVLLDGP